MADVIDDDTLQAVRNRWKDDHVGLPALFNEDPKTGRLKSPQQMPYADVACVLTRRESAGTGGAWHDYRKVTVRVRGVKADVVKALGFLNGIFTRDVVLTYPSGARFMRWWDAGGGDKLEQDPATKDGQDVWIGTVEGEVWSIRT